MSEASWEEKKLHEAQAHERALHVKYHLVHMCGSYYRVVTEESYNHCIRYRYVPGLAFILLDEANQIVQDLNRGDTTEEDYIKTGPHC